MKRALLVCLVSLPLAAFGCSSDSGGAGGTAGSGGSSGSGGSGGQAGSGGAGGATAECDPLQQDCDEGEGCYLNLQTGEQVCAMAVDPGTQGDLCEFINVCDPGYGCILIASEVDSDLTCAFFCDPDGGSPSCADGPGPAFDCRRIQGFYGDVPDVSLALGMCVDPLVFPDM